MKPSEDKARETVVTPPARTLKSSTMNSRAVIIALLSAALFGISTPADKVLLGALDPFVLAGLLYCGAGAGIAVLRRITRVWNGKSETCCGRRG